MEDTLSKQANLAAAVVDLLERGDGLAKIVLKARRLAEMLGDQAKVVWLSLEAAGLDGIGSKPQGGWSEEQVVGIEIFLRTRAYAQPASLDELLNVRTVASRRDRRHIATVGIATLEASAEPERPKSPVSEESLQAYAVALHATAERRRILELIRAAMHAWATAVVASTDSQLRLIRRFGKDSVVVFAAGGRILADLKNASEHLDRPSGVATAALLARNALLEMGRTLYSGPKEHVSPVDGKTYLVRQEKNQLHAYLDQLWSGASADKRQAIDESREALEEAYELGSKAKNPSAITNDEAERAVVLTYNVARTICFLGGFPSL